MENSNTQANEIARSVYQILREGTMAVSGMKAQHAALDEKIKSGRYSEAVIKGYREQRDSISRDIRMATDRTLRKAQEAVERYKTDAAARRNALNPSELTDDIRLLQSGIPLNQNDLESILDRTAGNRTMFHLTTRFAKEHGIAISGKYRIDDGEDERLARILSSITSYYGRWINTPSGTKMLNRFFGETFPHFFDEDEGEK